MRNRMLSFIFSLLYFIVNSNVLAMMMDIISQNTCLHMYELSQ